MIVLENTFNWGGGCVLSQDYVRGVARFAASRGLALHLDGARLANAAVASGRSMAELAAEADSVSLCLSKALGAPVGTMLAGRAEFIRAARRVRKLLGGAMRQAGILAAGGLNAIETPPDLARDHARARRLAEGLARTTRSSVSAPETNIVIVSIPGVPVPDVLAALRERGVLAVGFGQGRIRFVTHRDVGDDDVDRAIENFEQVMGTTRGHAT
jgi:threonine aldolase